MWVVAIHAGAGDRGACAQARSGRRSLRVARKGQGSLMEVKRQRPTSAKEGNDFEPLVGTTSDFRSKHDDQVALAGWQRARLTGALDESMWSRAGVLGRYRLSSAAAKKKRKSSWNEPAPLAATDSRRSSGYGSLPEGQTADPRRGLLRKRRDSARRRGLQRGPGELRCLRGAP